MEMITPKTCSPVKLRRQAADAQPPSPDDTQRAVENPERSGPGTFGIDQALTSIARPKARFDALKTRRRGYPAAGPLAGPLAKPAAASSSGASSPTIRTAHASCEVAG